jgi:hypothetical protein
MFRTLTAGLIVACPLAFGATTDPYKPNLAPKGRKLASNETSTNLGVETKTRQMPVYVEQDCPSPDLVDTVKTTSWNNLEGGISFPLDNMSDVRLYTRYTCAAPKTEPY